MESMPRPRPPHLHREVTRHGKAVWYVRLGKGKRIRIKAEFGTPDFEAEYQAAINGRPKAVKGTAAGSLAWLFEQYREAQVWRDLSLETRKQREAIMRQMIRSAGNQPFRQDHPSHHRRRPGPTRYDTGAGAPFPQDDARPV
jgi:hypothetical protein